MNKRCLLVIAICACTAFFCERDTKSLELWPRNVEPLLSNVSEWKSCSKTLIPGRVVEQALCGAPEPPPAATEPCDDSIEDHKRALRILSSEPHCTDAVIDALERFGRVDPKAMSDLAAAYYVRAQWEDRPSDFLRALEAAEQAVAAEPELPAAHFNRALVLEELGLSGPAIAAWDQFLQLADSRWEKEARQRRDRLQRSVHASARWERNRKALPDALRAHDRQKVARLIAPFPSAAQRYFEEELLPQWAASPAKEQLDRLSLFASELSQRLNGDRLPIDVIEAIRRAAQSPEKLAALQQAHRELTETRRMEQSFVFSDAAARYKTASAAFKRADSPFHLRVDLGYSIKQADVDLLEPIERQAIKHGYHDLRARVRWMHGHFTEQSNYADSLAAYDEALAYFARINDQEGLAAIRTRRAGVLRGFGAGEIAWREVFYAVRHAGHLINLKDRQVLMLEAAAVAVSLGHPRAALLYQTAAFEELQDVIRSVPPEDLHRIRQIQQTMAMVLRHRAGTQVRLGRDDRAVSDLTESVRLADVAGSLEVDAQRILQARVDEVRGQVLMKTDPDAAVAAYTSALANATSDFRSFRTSLLAQRAEAKVLAGRGATADKDLQSALAVLRTEEEAILASREHGEEEDFWSPYFSRFQDTYRLLIRRLVEKGDPALAFTYAERARAAEPLHLLLRLGYASPALIATAAPADEKSARASVAGIQASLPAGTFIIQYCVLEDRTYVWIISRDRFEHLTLDQVGREKTNRWSTELQEAARHRSTTAAERLLQVAHAELAAEPLRVIARTNGGVEPARLVFIPDGGIHGLPLVALRDSQTREYLIQRTPIEIAGSAALYVFSLRRDLELAPVRNPSVFIVGDPAFDESLALAQGLKRLDYARSEAEGIRDIYAPDTDILVGAEATVPALLQRAAAHSIVHVAGHAIVNAQKPSRSYLLLAPSKGNSGVLDAEDLLSLRLDRTRLFILSACSSAGGLPVGPEGVAPFVRPLLAAGVPAVIGSLWDVDDATTEKLMVSFHRHYQKGSEAAVAMRDAQLELLKDNNPGLRSVLAWAPFQVIGHASSPYAAHAPSNGGTSIGIHSSNSVHRSDRLRPE